MPPIMGGVILISQWKACLEMEIGTCFVVPVLNCQGGQIILFGSGGSTGGNFLLMSLF